MKFRNLSDDNRLLFGFYVFLLIIWVVFDTLKYIWADDPFQKVVLAPLGEEPFKFLLAFLLCGSVIAGKYLPRIGVYKKSYKTRQVNAFTFSNVFLYGFVPFSIVSAVVFGRSEGLFTNVVLHFSISTIGAVLIVLIYRLVKNKQWKTRYKLVSLFSILGLPMFLHSLANQYVNICVADSKPEFEYLVVIARFLEKHTWLSSQIVYTKTLFIIAYMFLVVWFMYIVVWPWSKKKRDARLKKKIG